MKIIDKPPHSLHAVDADLSHLRGLLMELLGRVKQQLQTAVRALERADMELAQTVIQFDGDISHREIDREALALLARYSPVADDLRTVVASLKIAVELQNIEHEISGFARLTAKVFDPKTSDPNNKILTELVKMGHLVRFMLCQMVTSLQNHDTRPLYALLASEPECEAALQTGIRHQLTVVLHDTRIMKSTLDLLVMMKGLEQCSERCKNLAEYIVYMLDGTDIRHTGALGDFPRKIYPTG